MKKKNFLWMIAFVIAVILPPVFAFFADPWLDHSNEENRTLAEQPILQVSSLEEYPKRYEEYYNDHLPFRNYLIKANSYIKWKLFKESASEQVILGKNGWLFYNADGSMEDYKKQLHFTQKELKKVRKKLLQVQNYCHERDIQFILMIAPNKETIYDEYMPDYVKRSETEEKNRAEQLIDYMAGTGVNIIYPKEELISYKRWNTLYYPLDSHWNSLGGYIGAKALLSELDVKIPELQTLQLEEDQNPRNDLAGMLNLKEFMDPGENYVPIEYSEVRVTPKLTDYQTVLSYESTAKDTRKLFVIRDSFSMALFEYLAASFQSYYTPKLEAYTPDMLEQESPDILVVEIVERNLGLLLDYHFLQ